MLLLLDLDNTLADRDGAFKTWATSFIDEIGGGPEDLRWLVAADASGYRSREELAQALQDRLKLLESQQSLVQRMRTGVLDAIRCYPGVLEELSQLSRYGVRLIVVTNGGSTQQREKIARTGLNALIDGVIISEEVGWKKPSPEIFLAATALVGEDQNTWMLGDSAQLDIGGAHALNLQTCWVSHGREWDHSLPYSPDIIRQNTANSLQALSQVRKNQL